MRVSASQSVPEETAEYLRQVRKIRAGRGNDPAHMHQAIRDLGGEANPEPSSLGETSSAAADERVAIAGDSVLALLPKRIDWSGSVVLGYRGSAAREFADLVASQLVGPILPWNGRVELLREAGKLGINRFEANLIIAAVQHYLGADPMRVRKRRQVEKSKSKSKLPVRLLTFVAVQGLIVAAIWYLVIN